MIFVDDLQPCMPNCRWRWKRAAHLASPDIEELHIFAIQIGLKRSWFQNHATIPHYDLTSGMHRRALVAGAKLVSGKELAWQCSKVFAKQRAERERSSSMLFDI